MTAKFLQSQQNFRNLSEIPGIADLHCFAYCSSSALIFLHFAFILSLIVGTIDG